jgi:serine/threonine protein kinase
LQREAVSPTIRREIETIIKSIRQNDISHARERLQDLAGQQLTRVNAALSKLRTDGAVVSHSSDAIREQIAAQHYDDAILDSEQAIAELTRIQEIYAKAKILKNTVAESSALALFENGNYEEFNRVCSEGQERRKIAIELKERATASLGNFGKFGRVPTAIQEKLASENISDIESAIKYLDAFAASAQPDLTLVLDRNHLVADKWHKVGVKITNNGDAHAFDVSFSFSSEFETRWIKPTNIDAGESKTIEIGILPKKEGSIPLEITVHCRDAHEKTYDMTHEFWIDVVDRMGLTPEKDAAATPPQSPVSRFTPKPLTPKQLPPDLSDRYTESEFIGKGGFARVFKAKRKDGKYVAVKIPISMDASTGRSFITEMQNWTRLNHTNIVKLYDFNIMPMPYFEMELCDNSLADRKKPIESEEAAWILFNVCEGLKFTHSNKIIHRDLKPQNILIKNGVSKISDWGLSRVISESTSTTTTSFTPYYAAPEQISSEHKDERTDIWQIGVIFYELVTGQLPFTGDSMVAIISAIASKNPTLPSVIIPTSQDVESMIMKCLEKNSGKRYQSVLELQKELALYLRITYTESLKMSLSVKDYTRSAYYCGDLVMVNLLTGDMKSAYKYILDLVHYSKGDVKVEARELSEQIKMRMEMGVEEIPDELIQKAEIIVHQVSLGFRKRNKP